MSRFQPYRLLWAILISTLLLDQYTKFLITQKVTFGTYQQVIGDFFRISHVHNYGAAWGILEGHGWFLSTLAIVALLAIFLYRKALELHTVYMQVVFGLICSGILGNLIDRLRLKYVIDFLDFGINSSRWPSFNIADSCIFCGVVLHLWHTWKYPPEKGS